MSWSPLRRRPRVYAEVRLPGIAVGTDDIGALFKRGRDAGPFLIISRPCGLALDTAFATDNDSPVTLWPPHGRRQQLWYLEPSGYDGEVLIISAESGLALDATRNPDAEKTVLSEKSGEVWQRWTLQRVPDGAGYLISSALSAHVLASSEDAANGWEPWMSVRDAGWSQQWLLVMPHGDTIK